MRLHTLTPRPPALRVSPGAASGEVALAQQPTAWHAALSIALLAAAGVDLAAQWPLWSADTALAIVNLVSVLIFVLTGFLLGRDADQRTVAYLIVLIGVFRALDFVDDWNIGPLPLYGLVFGGIDRVFGAWALLLYPGRRLTPVHRRYLISLTAWMIAGRSLVAVTSIPAWDGVSSTAWWPALITSARLNDFVDNVRSAGEALFGVVLIVLLWRRYTARKLADRPVLAPIVAAGIAAVVAAGASALAQTIVGLNRDPNQAFLIEGLVDLAIPLAFLVSATQRLALANADLRTKAAEAELRQVRESRARIVEAERRERERIEKDLHDGAQQRLVALAVRLRTAAARISDPEAADALRDARDELRKVNEELRELARGIHPEALTRGGLRSALNEVVDRLELHVECDILAIRLSPAVEGAAYFVACEALTNIVKHADADRAAIVAWIQDGELHMEISDDGVGGAHADGHGIAGMRDRVGALDGDLAIDSPSGQGTWVRVRIPCE